VDIRRHVSETVCKTVVMDKVLVMKKMSNTDAISYPCRLAVSSYLWLFAVDLLDLVNPWLTSLSLS
jgi:hypothetical protein